MAELAPGRAVLVGHLMVTMPAFVAIGAGVGVGWILGFDLMAWLIGGVLGWGTWSVLVPRWRDWVCRHRVDLDAVQRLARWTGLLWARGSFLERTEMRRRDGRRGW